MMWRCRSNGSVRTASRSTALAAAAIMLYCCTFTAPTVNGFNLSMEYKPPVKSSVKKLYDQRFPRDFTSTSSTSSRGTSTSTTRHNKQSSSASVSSFRSTPRSKSSQREAYAGALSQPTDIMLDTASDVAKSFERRMRELVLGNASTASSSSSTLQKTKSSVLQQQLSKKEMLKKLLPPNVMTIETLQEYKKVVGDETEKMVAVRFYAPWCRACKAVAPHFYRLANRFPNTIFVDVPVTNTNASLHQGLGVTSLPFGHIYHPTAGLVEELKLTRQHVTGFAKILQSYIQGSCEIFSSTSSFIECSEEEDEEDAYSSSF